MLGRNIGIAAQIVILFGHACCGYVLLAFAQPTFDAGMGVFGALIAVAACSVLAFPLLVIGMMVASSGDRWPYPDRRMFALAWATWAYPALVLIGWLALATLAGNPSPPSAGSEVMTGFFYALGVVAGLIELGLVAATLLQVSGQSFSFRRG